MRPPLALSLDLDGTLLDPQDFPAAIERACDEIASLLPGLDGARLFEANGRVWRDYSGEIEAEWELARDDTEIVNEGWRSTFRACDFDYDDATLEIARRVFSGHAQRSLRLYDDVEGLLDSIEIPTILVTNGPPIIQREKLRVLGIEDRFDVVVVSGEIGFAKPDPRVFDAALSSLGVAAEGTWHVGDNPDTDVAGARAAGLVAVWLNRDGASHDAVVADREVSSLAELFG